MRRRVLIEGNPGSPEDRRRVAARGAAGVLLIVGAVCALGFATPALAADLDVGPSAGPGPGYGPDYGPGYPRDYYRPRHPGYGYGYRAPGPRYRDEDRGEPYPYPPPHAWGEPPRGYYPPPRYSYRSDEHNPPHAWYGVPPGARGAWVDPDDRDDYDGYRRGPYPGPYAEQPRPPATAGGPPPGARDRYPPEASDEMAEEDGPPSYGWRPPPRPW